MVIDERIEELSEEVAKRLLRRAVEEIADGMACKNCAMKLVCGLEATEDDCMCRVYMLLGCQVKDKGEGEKRNDAKTIFYDPKTMRIVD